MLSKRDDNADAQKVYTARRRVPRSKSPLSIESPVGSVGGTPAGYIYNIYVIRAGADCDDCDGVCV